MQLLDQNKIEIIVTDTQGVRHDADHGFELSVKPLASGFACFVNGAYEEGLSGEHSVLFCGRDEVIELKHTVFSREVFAVGAVRAAKYMAGIEEPGMYDMANVLA